MAANTIYMGTMKVCDWANTRSQYSSVSTSVAARMGKPVENVSPWALVLYKAVWAYAFAAHTYLGDATDRNTLPSFLDHLGNIETPGVNGPLQLNGQGDRVSLRV